MMPASTKNPNGMTAATAIEMATFIRLSSKKPPYARVSFRKIRLKFDLVDQADLSKECARIVRIS
jgi:hypothetical protein